MANLDDVIRNAVPGGNIAKPLLIALMGLLASGALFKDGGAQGPAAAPQPVARPVPMMVVSTCAQSPSRSLEQPAGG